MLLPFRNYIIFFLIRCSAGIILIGRMPFHLGHGSPRSSRSWITREPIVRTSQTTFSVNCRHQHMRESNSQTDQALHFCGQDSSGETRMSIQGYNIGTSTVPTKQSAAAESTDYHFRFGFDSGYHGMSLPNDILRCVSNYLNGRWAFVEFRSQRSKYRKVKIGVPQVRVCAPGRSHHQWLLPGAQPPVITHHIDSITVHLLGEESKTRTGRF